MTAGEAAVQGRRPLQFAAQIGSSAAASRRLRRPWQPLRRPSPWLRSRWWGRRQRRL